MASRPPHAAPPAARLAVEGLRTVFPGPDGSVEIVRGVSFDVGAGEIVGLVGESGSGKSMAVRSILGLVPAPGRVVAGTALLEGRDLVGLRRRELRRVRGAQIALVPQDPFSALNPVLRIADQYHNVLAAHRKVTRAASRAAARETMASLGLPDPDRILAGYAHELSGGMAQRVVIALALALSPGLLIADEPTTALDLTAQRQILDLLRRIVAERGASILLVTHDLSVVAQYCERMVVMHDGAIVETGRVAEVFAGPAHEYTRKLLDAIPRTAHQPVVSWWGERGAGAMAIDGEPQEAAG